MGKKRVVVQTGEEILKEHEKLESLPGLKKKVRKKLEKGRIYISSSFNNTIMTLTDMMGNVIFWVSAGSVGFKGTKKSTPYAASKVAEAMAHAAQQLGVKEVEVFVKGPGSGRDTAIRTLAARGLEISRLKDITPIPHNGCRPPKPRRV